jgi:hypothetical protein
VILKVRLLFQLEHLPETIPKSNRAHRTTIKIPKALILQRTLIWLSAIACWKHSYLQTIIQGKLLLFQSERTIQQKIKLICSDLLMQLIGESHSSLMRKTLASHQEVPHTPSIADNLQLMIPQTNIRSKP